MLQDDPPSIADNLSIRRLWPPGPVLSPPADAGVAGRPLLNLSFALNYAAGGSDVQGYHLVNLAIHLLGSLALFALVRRTLRRPRLSGQFGAAADGLALFATALWAWHPLLTESVTYISQRAESLMGFCYLLTLYCFVRGAETRARRPRWAWFLGSVVSCLAGSGFKEVIVTAPLVVWLYDRTFVSGGFFSAWKRHYGLYLALAACGLPLFYHTFTRHGVGVGFGEGADWWAYAVAECRVIVKYLGLTVWPHPLVFDYGEFAPPDWGMVWPFVPVFLLVLASAVVALARWPAVGFAAAWFLLILAPTSSVVPVVGQAMAENRLYLPLAAVAVVAGLGAYTVAGRRSYPVLAVAAAALAVASFERNLDYGSAESLWRDTLAKCPENARAHRILGNILAAKPGSAAEAMSEYETAMRMKPDDAVTHNNYGNLLLKTPGRMPDATAQYRAAERLRPGVAVYHDNLGYVWLKTPGKLAEAVAEFETALRLKPDFPEAHENLGTALQRMPGRHAGAISHFEAAVHLDPDNVQAHNNLGNALLRDPGRLEEAITQYRQAVRLRPDSANGHLNLGYALLQDSGRAADAASEFQLALRLRPDLPEAHLCMALALSRLPGRQDEERKELQEVLRLQPGNDQARRMLASAETARPAQGPP